MAVQYGNQPATVVSQAHGRDSRQSLQREPSDVADQGIRSAIARNTEREAVIDERAVLADALRHEMGFVRTAGVKDSFATAVQQGALIEMPQREGRGSRAFTTPEMKQCEAEVLQCMARGLGTCEELASPSISRSVLESHSYLNESQHAAAAIILGSRDRIMGLEGKAGTGKTTTLKAVCEAAKKAGFQVEGLAPTSRAALNLADAEIPTMTLARHQMKSQEKASGSKHLYIVDESTLASTRQMNDFMKCIRQHDRVLFVGDTQQHEAVDAGRPYAQLQEAGMHSARLTEIVRQKDAGLRTVVEQLAVGNVEGALSDMAKQGRIHEFVGRKERIDAIVHSYTENPKGTLIISPDNDSRQEIAQRIHEEMRNTGQVKGEEHTVQVLTTKQNLTNEDRRWAQNYEPGDVLRFTTSSKAIGVASRESVRVAETQDEKNLITVERQDGKRITYSPERVYGVTAYREAERRFAEGDRVQFSATFHPQNVPNRTLGTIDKINEAGDLTLQMDSGRSVSFNLRQHPHLDYGYAVTSHSSQSETVDNVLIHVDSEHVHKGLINNRMAYVAISRARFDAQIFTNDAESLAYELSKDVSHSTALRPDELKQAIESSNSHSARESSSEHSVGLGF
jgi:ATP-dependent exoDNAse (exonuclease V) alpha subunit